MSDHLWNVIGALAIGGAFAMLILAWPFIESLFFYAAFALVGLLILGFVLSRIFGPKRGWTHRGITYRDFWRDD